MRRALLLIALCLGARPALALQGFESGLGSWTTSGLWRRVVSPACVSPHAGTACLYFGRGVCDYDDGQIKDASVTSGPVNLTDPARAFVSFWMLYQVESDDPACYDELRLELSYDKVHWSLLQKLSTNTDPAGSAPSAGLASGSGLAGTPQWLYRHVDLSAYLGLTIYLRFRFVDSGTEAGESLCGPPDSAFDNFLGYALDDINFYDDPEPVSLLKSVAPPYGPPGSALTYTLVAANKDSAPRDLSVWDSLPSAVSFVSATAPGVLNGAEVDWSLPGVAAGAAVTLSLVVQSAPSAGVPQDWSNTAWAQSNAPGLSATSQAVPYKLRAPGLSLRKTVSSSVVTNGDEITYTLVAQNFSTLTLSATVLQEQLPTGFLLQGSSPAINLNNGQWALSPLTPGDLRSFSLWGPIFANDGQTLVNVAQLFQAGSLAAQDQVGVKVNKPIEPQVWLRGLYPNPAPGGNAAFGEALHIGYELNQSMPMTIDIYTVAGEKVRSLAVNGTRGTHDAVWDLKNAWGADVASGIYGIRVWGDAKVRPLPEAFGFAAVLR